MGRSHSIQKAISYVETSDTRIIQRMTTQAFKDRMTRLIEGPRHPQQAFTTGGATYASVYAMAAHIKDRLGAEVPAGQPVCLCAEDKAMTAAALLAALAGGPALVLPYALSADVLADLQDLTGYTHAVTDGPRSLPTGRR